ncbi:Golgi transport complex [Salix suchowensis]|nr:Golgi transport complex [Salix suchowensis]
MASTRSAPRRAPTNLSSPSPSQPRPPTVISVEEWESKAPLGELQTRSVALIKEASEKLPLPLKARDASPSWLEQAIDQAGSSHALHPKQPIQTLEQFYDWFALIDRSVTHSQEAHFRAHLAGVSQHLDECDFLVERIEEIDKEVNDMLQGWRSVEEGGKSLKEACEKLLEERVRCFSRALPDTRQASRHNGQYWRAIGILPRAGTCYADAQPPRRITRLTNRLPVYGRTRRLCIDFLKLNRHYKDAEVYLLRFQQCMTRAMTLIKMFFVGSLRALSSDVSKKLSEGVRPSPQRSAADRRARAQSRGASSRLSTLLSECHTAYFNTRKTLLVGRVVEEIRGLDPARTELVELTRAGCSYLKQLCTDEFELYREFFSTGEDQL